MLEIFELLVVLRKRLIIQTIGFFVCMENQTNREYNECTGFTGSGISGPPGFGTEAVPKLRFFGTSSSAGIYD
jgi:hypothetical protein